MDFKQIPPPDYLKEYVKYFWVLDEESVLGSVKSFRTMADGCPGLIFQHADHGILFQNDKELPDIFLYGQATTPAELRLRGSFNAVGICFYPNALKSIFGLNADELTDTCMNPGPEAIKYGFSLSEQLSGAATVTDRIEMLSSYLFFQIRRHEKYRDPAMPYALSRIMHASGNVSLADLRTELQLSERSFERKFKQHVGISPKLFTRISRFQASLHQLRNSRYDKLSDVAFGNEYADQSHFIRAFKEFAGFSPLQYQKQSPEIIENLARIGG